MAAPVRDEGAELAEVERARLRALVAGDLAAAAELHADDFQLITPGGAALSKDEYLSELASGRLRYLAWEPEAIAVRVEGAAACLRYRSSITVVHGADRSGPSAVWHTDYYERRDGRWRVVWSHATHARSA